MKTVIISVVALVIAISGAVYGYKYWQENIQQKGEAPIVLQKTLEGILTPIQSTGEYSDVITVDGKVTGVTSSTVNLKPYENHKVKITGEYSGSTMYADSVTLTP